MRTFHPHFISNVKKQEKTHGKAGEFLSTVYTRHSHPPINAKRGKHHQRKNV